MKRILFVALLVILGSSCDPELIDPLSGIYFAKYDDELPFEETVAFLPTGTVGWVLGLDIPGAIQSAVHEWWVDDTRTHLYIQLAAEPMARTYTIISESAQEVRIYGFTEGKKFILVRQ